MGILGAAGVVFFAFIGFDAVSTAAQEAKNPKRDMPIGILGSLVICTILYVLFSYVLSGVATVEDFRTAGKEASVTFAITKYMTGYGWLAKFVTVAILAGFSSVILVMLLGQSRVFYSMSRDGLVPKVFSDVHPKYQTPWKSNMLFFVFTAGFAAFIPGDIVGEMTSIGTLFAFMLVCAGVWILRVKRPELPRAFKVAWLPVVSTLGIVVCGAMIYGLGWTNWLRLGVWLAIGLVFYFAYGRNHSKLPNPHPRDPDDSLFFFGGWFFFLPFSDVISGGSNLSGPDAAMLTPYAQTSLKYLLAGCLIGGIVALAISFAMTRRKGPPAT